MTEQQLAQEILSRFGDPHRVVVHPKEIARKMGCRVEPLPIGSDLSGEYEVDEKGVAILRYNQTESTVRQRFTIAHELGHHVLKHESGKRDPAKNYSLAAYDPAEAAANRFAAELLMPADMVRKLVTVNQIQSVSELAATLGVSEVAMKYRLQNLRLV